MLMDRVRFEKAPNDIPTGEIVHENCFLARKMFKGSEMERK